MAKSIAIAALRHLAVNGLTCISQSLKVLIWCCRPDIHLLGSTRLIGPAPGNRMLLAKVSLQVHVGVSGAQLLFDGNEPDGNLLSAEGLLELDVSDIGACLSIHLDSFLEII